MSRWLPKVTWQGHSMSDGGDPADDAEGWLLEIEWRGWIVQIGMLRRGHAYDEFCTCQAYPTHSANDCPLHGLDD